MQIFKAFIGFVFERSLCLLYISVKVSHVEFWVLVIFVLFSMRDLHESDILSIVGDCE